MPFLETLQELVVLPPVCVNPTDVLQQKINKLFFPYCKTVPYEFSIRTPYSPFQRTFQNILNIRKIPIRFIPEQKNKTRHLSLCYTTGTFQSVTGGKWPKNADIGDSIPFYPAYFPLISFILCSFSSI